MLGNTMRISLTKIGNSKGVIIPASVLKQCGIRNEVDINVEDHQIIISPPDKTRQGWLEAIEQEGPDTLLLDEAGNDFDENEWTW